MFATLQSSVAISYQCCVTMPFSDVLFVTWDRRGEKKRRYRHWAICSWLCFNCAKAWVSQHKFLTCQNFIRPEMIIDTPSTLNSARMQTTPSKTEKNFTSPKWVTVLKYESWSQKQAKNRRVYAQLRGPITSQTLASKRKVFSRKQKHFVSSICSFSFGSSVCVHVNTLVSWHYLNV